MSKCVRAMVEVSLSLLAGVAVLPQAETFEYDSAARPCMKHWNTAINLAVLAMLWCFDWAGLYERILIHTFVADQIQSSIQ